MQEQGRIIVDRKSFLTGLKLVRHAVAKKDSRPFLNGIDIYSNINGTIDIVGADGLRFGMYTMPAVIEGRFSGIFPLDLILKLKGIEKKEITISIPMPISGLSIARINGEGIELIAGQYPNWRKLIPAEFTHKATFITKGLKVALEAVKVVAKESSGAVGLETTEGNTLKILAGSKDERIIREIPAQVENPGKIAIHWRNLRDALKTGASTISFNGLSDECVLTGVVGLIEVIKPMYMD